MNIVVAEREQIRLYTYLIYLQYKNLRESGLSKYTILRR